MRTKRSPYTAQRGSSVIEFPIITLVMVILVLFVIKINQGINHKNQLNALAYSLTSIVACDECDNGMNKPASSSATPGIISDELADSLFQVAQRHFTDLIVESSADIGLQLEQLIFDPLTKKSKRYPLNRGVECDAATSLSSLEYLSPQGTKPGINAGQRAELFQVTLCIKGIESFGNGITPLFIRSFSDRYYQSSALLIGRKI
ncbi:MAG: tight adherence protein F [Moritella dasanensis]|jgi:tight adherence protein F